MEKIKSPELALLHRVYRFRGNERLAVTVMAGFNLADSSNLLSEDELWEKAALGLAAGQALDQGMPKPGGEVLAAGQAHAPEGRPVKGLEVGLRCGPVKKSLTVFGDRRWSGGGLSMTKPEPFTQMDITWDRAFGGKNYQDNPEGCGLASIERPDGESWPLPNIEDPGDLIASPDDRPRPAGLAPVGLGWPGRLKGLGTFNDEWLANDWPGLPQDFDYRYFNVAPFDQRIKGYFKGDETIEAFNLAPDRPHISSNLPGRRARAFIHLHDKGRHEQGGQDKDGQVFTEISLNLDTVWLMPHLDLGVLIWHGTTPITDDDADDVELLAAFIESSQEEPKPLEYYQAQCHKALEAESPEISPPLEASAVAAAAEAEAPEELVPETEPQPPTPEEESVAPEVSPLPAPADPYEGLPPELVELMPPLSPPPPGADLETLHRHHLDQATALDGQLKDMLRKMGLDPDEPGLEELPPELAAYMPDTPPPPEGLSLEELAAFHRDQAAALQGKLDDHLASLGIKPDDVEELEIPYTVDDSINALQKLPGAEPIVEAIYEIKRDYARAEAELKARQAELAALESAAAARSETGEAEIEAADEAAEAEVRETEKVLTREDVIEAKAEGRSLAGTNLVGLDLSAVDLAGLDLSGANLEGADLSQADLSNSNLNGTILTAANLTGTVLTKVSLNRSNLSQAKLTGTDLKGASLVEADLTRADLSESALSGADLTAANLTGASLVGAQADGIKAGQADFSQADLTRSDLTKAQLGSCEFSEATLDQADFTQADLSQSWLSQAKGRGVNFEAANLQNIRSSGETNLPEIKAQGADLTKAYFENSDLSGADFTATKMNQASFINCRLKEADLSRVEAKGADYSHSDLTGAGMTGINLLNGSLRKARLTGADLRGSNLFAVDLYKSVQGQTNLDGANLKRTLLTLWTNK